MREKVFLQTSQTKPVKFKTLQLVLLDIHFLHEKEKKKKQIHGMNAQKTMMRKVRVFQSLLRQTNKEQYTTPREIKGIN